MPFEVANALHRRVTRGELSVGGVVELIGNLLESKLEFHHSRDLHGMALEFATRFRQGAAYDCHYLALAESLGCDLWTADERFYSAVRDSADRVRWVGEQIVQQ